MCIRDSRPCAGDEVDIEEQAVVDGAQGHEHQSHDDEDYESVTQGAASWARVPRASIATDGRPAQAPTQAPAPSLQPLDEGVLARRGEPLVEGHRAPTAGQPVLDLGAHLGKRRHALRPARQDLEDPGATRSGDRRGDPAHAEACLLYTSPSPRD